MGPTGGNVHAVLLGCAQDGGVPQTLCNCCNCARARSIGVYKDGRVTSLGLVDGDKCFLIDATPDIGSQVADLQAWVQGPTQKGWAAGGKGQLSGLLLTHAHTGHYAGLLQLGKEGANVQGLPVYCSARMAAFISSNLPWSTLVTDGCIVLHELTPLTEVMLSENLAVTPVRVPHREDITDTLAFLVSVSGRGDMQMLYCPDTDTWEGWEVNVSELCNACEVALLDATFYGEGELGGRDISQVPHPLVTDTLKRMKGSSAEVVLIHMNHTNPLFTEGSAAQKEVASANVKVGHSGMVWTWPVPIGEDGPDGDTQPSAASPAPEEKVHSMSVSTAAPSSAPSNPAGDPALAAAAVGDKSGRSGNSSGTGAVAAKELNGKAAAAKVVVEDNFEPSLEDSPPLPQPDDEVVAWDEAVEQCSGDEEFLRELLVDLWNETMDHLTDLTEKVPKGETVACGRIGHAIKGAAANLMVKRLRDAAFNLEKVGKAAAQDVGGPEKLQALLEAAFRRVTFELEKLEHKLRDWELL